VQPLQGAIPRSFPPNLQLDRSILGMISPYSLVSRPWCRPYMVLPITRQTGEKFWEKTKK
jgi:hypothetical protein